MTDKRYVVRVVAISPQMQIAAQVQTGDGKPVSKPMPVASAKRLADEMNARDEEYT